MQTGWTSDLLPIVPKMVGKCFETGYLALGIVNDPEPNATIRPVDSEGHAIIFNVGLINFIYSVARILSTRVRLLDRSRPTATRTRSPSFDETVRLIYEVLWCYQQTQDVASPDYPVRRYQKEWATMLAVQAELFLIAHEIGHFVRRQLDTVISRVADAARSAGQPLDELLADLRAPGNEEYGADEIGALLALGVFGRDYPGDERMALQRYSGVEFGFQIFRALEAIGVKFARSHPPAYHRIENVRSCVRAYCEGNPATQRRVANLGFLTLLVLERKLTEANAAFNSFGSRQLDVWPLPGLPFAERMGRRAYWIDAIFSEAIDLMTSGALFNERYKEAASRTIKRLNALAERYVQHGPQLQQERRELEHFATEAAPIVDRGYIREIVEFVCQVNERAVQSLHERHKLLLLLSVICRRMNTATKTISLRRLRKGGYVGRLSGPDFSELLTLLGCDTLVVTAG